MAHKQLTNTPFLNLKQTEDGYFYAERKGIDSVAFVLLDNITQQIGVANEFKPPLNKFMLTAFGGSLDKNKTPKEIVVEEAIEEAGYIITQEDVKYLGKVLCSTQMNQMVHLFIVNVDKTKQQTKTSTDPREKDLEVVWKTPGEVIELEDWKAITILTKYSLNKNF